MSVMVVPDAWQVERIASMLNYFLLQLVGPQRKALRVKDPEKYEFRPKELLSQVQILGVFCGCFCAGCAALVLSYDGSETTLVVLVQWVIVDDLL